MEDTQKFDARSQTSCSIEHLLSKSAVHGDESSRPLAMPSSHDSDHPSADTKIILGWMRELPKEFLDTIRELMSMALDRFGQFSSAAVNHPEDVSDLEEQEKRFRLFMDGDGDLDERLFEAPDVRSAIVTNLKALVRDLGTAISLFAPEQRQTLSKETDEVFGEAPDHPLHDTKRLACGSPEITPEVLKAIKIQIKSSIANLYGLLSTSRHLGKISNAPEARQNEEVESEKRRPFFSEKFKNKARNFCRRARTSILPPSGSPSSSHGAENSCVPRPIQANPSSKQSSRSANSPSDPSLFSKNGTHGRVHPLTNTTTSTSLSEEKQSCSKLTASNSFRGSNSCNERNAMLDEAEKTFEPEVSGGQLKQVKALNMVLIKHQNCEQYLPKLMLTDTGAYDNFIRRSVVDELGLTIIVQSNPDHHTGLDGHVFTPQGVVVPEWHFKDKPKTKQKRMCFSVIAEIPDNVDIILGIVSSQGIGIDLYERSVCVAHPAPEDAVAQEQRQQQRMRQDRDTTENENRIRQKLEAEHAELIEQREAAAEASNHTRSGISTSPRVVFGSGDVRL